MYDTLRTKEQLGYSVNAAVRLTHGMLGFAVVVVSGAPPLSASYALSRHLSCLRQGIGLHGALACHEPGRFAANQVILGFLGLDTTTRLQWKPGR